jgi:hypothetical protein
MNEQRSHTESGWARVTDDTMPEEFTAVLVAFGEDGEDGTRRYWTVNDTLEWTGEKWRVHDTEWDYPGTPTHWMALPEPPPPDALSDDLETPMEIGK